jgi:oligopeptide/dipeptide ABC transporter ATP-binding protein
MSKNRKKLIEIADLCVNFESPEGLVQAVRDVNFYVRTGEIIGVVGESGSGKTVTTSTLLGWLQGSPGIVSGKVIYYDQNENPHSVVSVKKSDNFRQDSATKQVISDEQLNKKFAHIRKNDITMIFQEPKRYLNPFWTVSRHFEDVFESQGRTDVFEGAKGFLKSVGLPLDIINKFPHELSGGMNQRLMIALALAREPRLLIADEMTTGLDVNNQVKIAHLMSNLVAEAENQDRSIIIISHDIAFVIKIVNMLMVMYAGEIVEFGPAHLFYDDDMEDNHPYTNALLDVYYGRNKSFIQGDVPSSTNPMEGCPFRARNCTTYEENKEELHPLCSKVRPKKYFISNQNDHWVRCHKFTLEPWSKIVSTKD